MSSFWFSTPRYDLFWKACNFQFAVPGTYQLKNRIFLFTKLLFATSIASVIKKQIQLGKIHHVLQNNAVSSTSNANYNIVCECTNHVVPLCNCLSTHAGDNVYIRAPEIQLVSRTRTYKMASCFANKISTIPNATLTKHEQSREKGKTPRISVSMSSKWGIYIGGACFDAQQQSCTQVACEVHKNGRAITVGDRNNIHRKYELVRMHIILEMPLQFLLR